MNQSHRVARWSKLVVLTGILLTASGCSWLRGSSDYDKSPESRPLEVPPDLDTPRTDPSMEVPMPTAAPARAAAAVPGSAFVISDSVGGAWRRLGLALKRIDGVAVSQQAEALSAYTVTYGGQEFLLRVVAAGEQSRIEAVGSDGVVLNAGPAADLLGLLRARLG